MLKDLIEDRLRKRERLVGAGVDPYPAKSPPRFLIGDLLKNFKKFLKTRKTVTLVGRLASFRDQGGLVFTQLKDPSGETQLVLRKGVTKDFSLAKETLDRGDFLWVKGKSMLTKRGEKSLEVRTWGILSKALRPVPDTFYGLKDEETLFRKRYLDFLVHPERRELFHRKAIFWQTTRAALLEAGFLEVETPVLEIVPGGAEAEPFLTHYNALNQDFYLRISLELSLKRLMVAGFEKVFEIGRIFRNEGIDAEHLQDYTQMEMYWAYEDYNGLMKFIERMMKKVIKNTTGSLITSYGGQKISWGKAWPRLEYSKLFKQATGLDVSSVSREELLKKAKELKLEHVDPSFGKGRLIDLLYKKTVRPKLIQPAFLINPPVEVEPLAKRMVGDPRRVERFQIVAGGTELGKGFSELNDPQDQRARFEEQMKLRAAGDKEAQMIDEDYIEAMEYGMPPTAGFGFSERLFAVLMDKSVRETVLFPAVRAKE